MTREVLGRRWRGMDGAHGDELPVLEDAGMERLRVVVVWPREIFDALFRPEHTLAKGSRVCGSDALHFHSAPA